MTKDAPETTIKKTVVIDPVVDRIVRKVWAQLIERGCDASYSTAVNFMILAATMEALRKGGLSLKTKETIWAFAYHEGAIDKLNLVERLAQAKEFWEAEQ